MDEISGMLQSLRGVRFVKMTGSGNDFVFFDGRAVSREVVRTKEVVAAICNRHNGIGADGVVVLEPGDRSSEAGDATIHYFNSDGSPADLCGNATLCSTRLAVEIGLGHEHRMSLMTPAGLIQSRLAAGEPEIDLQPVHDVRPEMPIGLAEGESRIGFVQAGIPHLVILCDDVDRVELTSRGPGLRRHPASGPAGANVNWVAPGPSGNWHYRTFERGVEGETLACGTGAIATAILLVAWGLTSSPVGLITRSGLAVAVRLSRPEHASGSWLPSLRGEGRVVFRGEVGDLEPS
ncbi:MAG: diaminopimelate epimerase [Gemmatimonadota bacterium]